MATIQGLMAQLYQVLIGQPVLAILATWGVIDILRRVFTMCKWLACIHCRKPKIVFGEIFWAPRQDVSSYEYYIPVANARLKGWYRRNCIRDDAIECQIKVRFTVEDKQFVEANWWSDGLKIGKILKPDSLNEIFPLVTVEIKEIGKLKISLAGTSASTMDAVPPKTIPSNTDIIADVSVISEGKEIGKGEWCILVEDTNIDPVKIKRIK